MPPGKLRTGQWQERIILTTFGYKEDTRERKFLHTDPVSKTARPVRTGIFTITTIRNRMILTGIL